MIDVEDRDQDDADQPDDLGDDMTDAGGSDALDSGSEKTPSLEERLTRLEEIVRSLEAADLDMEGALALFEEGVEHVRGAEATLRIAELKVEELLGPGEDPAIRPMEEASE
jgi:exodeoxyribonuclease VII small subunit